MKNDPNDYLNDNNDENDDYEQLDFQDNDDLKYKDIQYVKYRLYDDNLYNNSNSLLTKDQQKNHYQQLLNDINQFIIPYYDTYIWQKDPFKLKLFDKESNKKLPLYHIYGRTEFDELIDDEWFIVYLLIEISKRFTNLSISIKDNDGQFLLIEAAKTLPKWIKPTSIKNRVFIKNAMLHIIPLPTNPSLIDVIPYRMNVFNALEILSNPSKYPTIKTNVSSDTIKVILDRINIFNNNGYYNEQNHIRNVYLPAEISYLLIRYPQLLSEIVSTFYNRDVDDMKSVTKMERFGKIASDSEYIESKIRFTRCLYAQIKLQEFHLPPNRGNGLSMPSIKDPLYESKLLGTKLLAALEMLYANAQRKTLFERYLDEPPDLDTYKFHIDSYWIGYKEHLVKSGYFEGEREGSARFKHKLQIAKQQYIDDKLYLKNIQQPDQQEGGPAVDKVGSKFKIASLIDETINWTKSSDGKKQMMDTIASFKNSNPTSSDEWLQDSPEKLEDLITLFEKQQQQEQQQEKGNKGNSKSKDTVGLFSKSFKSMLSQVSSIDGIDFKDDKGTKDGVSFDSKKFVNILKSLVGGDIDNDNDQDDSEEEDPMYQSINDFDDDDDDDEENSDDDDDQDDDQDDSEEDTDSEEENQDSDSPEEYIKFIKRGSMKSIMKQMDQELNFKSVGDSFEKVLDDKDVETILQQQDNNSTGQPSTTTTTTTQPKQEGSAVKKVDLNLNLVKNILESLSEQHGLAGPASNLLRELSDNQRIKK
ncbi:hypothetical protein CYY_007996 [Polysphondylium violaceum]|uniref:Uncharacterized protein n=1 Tax=Polysphondylium violaceum TaxID=133409 RepID=A0A8J4UXB1_9MYCE|nr:hypothetical protein CYY_007996 [Polysphondylium violaceum]